MARVGSLMTFPWDDREQTLTNMLSNARAPKDEADLRYWLENMVTHHRFRMDEVRAATGLSFEDIASALQRL